MVLIHEYVDVGVIMLH